MINTHILSDEEQAALDAVAEHLVKWHGCEEWGTERMAAEQRLIGRLFRRPEGFYVDVDLPDSGRHWYCSGEPDCICIDHAEES